MQKSRESRPVIAIVDDDPSVREGLHSLIRSAGWRAETFASAQEFLARPGAEAPSCLMLDLQLPGLSGLDLQKRMAEVGLEIPIVFLTGHGNIPASVQAMKAGAIEFLTKPVDEQDLLRAIQEAIERDRRTRQQHAEMRESAESVRLADRARAGSDAAGDLRPAEQASCGRAEHHRIHGQDSSRAGHAQDACRFSGGSGEDGGEPGNPLA